jgi:hypothetical protein
MYMRAVIRLILKGDPIGYYDCGNGHGRRGEEDDESPAKDNASRQHPSVVIYARHLAPRARPRIQDLPRVLKARVIWGWRAGILL